MTAKEFEYCLAEKLNDSLAGLPDEGVYMDFLYEAGYKMNKGEYHSSTLIRNNSFLHNRAIEILCKKDVQISCYISHFINIFFFKCHSETQIKIWYLQTISYTYPFKSFRINIQLFKTATLMKISVQVLYSFLTLVSSLPNTLKEIINTERYKQPRQVTIIYG